MGLASGVILNSQIDASHHIGEFIPEKVPEHPQQSVAVPSSFGFSDGLSSSVQQQSALRLKVSPVLQAETGSSVR